MYNNLNSTMNAFILTAFEKSNTPALREYIEKQIKEFMKDEYLQEDKIKETIYDVIITLLDRYPGNITLKSEYNYKEILHYCEIDPVYCKDGNYHFVKAELCTSYIENIRYWMPIKLLPTDKTFAVSI